MTTIHGIWPALITPFDATGKVNHIIIRELVRFQRKAGVNGFFVNGGTGEGLLLDPAERKATLETVLDEVGGQLPVIAHVGAVATYVAADLAAHAAQAGATAVAAIPPIYFRVDMEALKAHYREIAGAAGDLPVWLYHVPGATGVSISSTMFSELLNVGRVGGLKYTSYDFFEMRNMIELSQEQEIAVMSGPDEMCLPGLVMGAHGAIGTTYNILPGHFVRLYESLQKGNLAQAQSLQFEANRVIKAFLSVPALAAVKEMLLRMGFNCGVPRQPLRPLTGSERELLWQELEATRFAELTDIPLEN